MEILNRVPLEKYKEIVNPIANKLIKDVEDIYAVEDNNTQIILLEAIKDHLQKFANGEFNHYTINNLLRNLVVWANVLLQNEIKFKTQFVNTATDLDATTQILKKLSYKLSIQKSDDIINKIRELSNNLKELDDAIWKTAYKTFDAE